MGSIPPITLFLLIATCATSIAAFNDNNLLNKLTFDPYLIKHRNQWYRFITGAFVHADWIHLFFNMWALYMFGKIVERGIYPELFNEKGPLFFGLLYFGGIVLSSTWSYEKHKNNPHYRALGASGAVSAIIMPFVLVAPMENLYFFFIPMPSVVFAILYLAASWYLARRPNQIIGHDAHFWGAVFGLAFTIVLNAFVGEVKLISHFLGELGIHI